MNRAEAISKFLTVVVVACTLSLVSPGARADVQTNVFTGTLSLGGDISEFFDVSGNPLPGVSVSNSAASSIPGQPGTAGLAKSPLGVLGSQTGQYHPSGYNQRRLIGAYNPYVNGGTIYVGLDLPGGTGSAANPDYQDPLTCGGSPPCPTSTSSPIQRGSIRPFDSDGNGEPQSIGRMGDGVTVLKRCADVTTNSIVDLFTCSDPSGAQGATDDPSNPLTDPGVVESYSLSLIYTNGVQATADLIEDNTTASGHAKLVIGGTPGFGVIVSMNNSGIPQGFDVEFAITNVNAMVDPCTRLMPTVVAVSGSNGDGPAQGEDTEIVRMQYVLTNTVQCQVLFFTNETQVVTNLCGKTADVGVNVGDTVVAQVVVTAGAGNPENLVNLTLSGYIDGATNTILIAGPLAPGQSVTNTISESTCQMPGVHGVMAVVNASSDVSDACSPIMSMCENTFECCGSPGVAVEKLVACSPAGGLCAAASNYGKAATGTVSQTQSPAFCYSILVTNTGNVVLQLTSVVDNVLGNLTSFFPSSLPVNGSATAYFSAAYPNDVVNSVTVNGSAEIAQGIETNVMASDNAMVHVVPASVICQKLVSTNGVDFSDHVSVLADGTPHNVTYEVIVTAGAQSPLANVTIIDPTLESLECTNPAPFSLAAGAQTNITLCTVPIRCTAIGDGTNTISVSANVDSSVSPFLCALDSNGAPITVNSTCQAVVSCVGTSSITVVKEVICQPTTTVSVGKLGDISLDPYAGSKSASGVVVGGQCPKFSYRIIVINNGQLPLNSVTVSDPLFGGLLSGYPGTLAPGDAATNFFSATLCSNTINTVTVQGIGTDASDTATDSASVAILNASVSCTKLVSTDGVNFASTATILQDGSAHAVYYQLTVQNTSDSGVSLTGFSVSDLNGCLGGVTLPTSLTAGGSFSVTCTSTLDCARIGGSLTNMATVSAFVDSQQGTVCAPTNAATSSCSAVVNCQCVPNIAVTKEVLCASSTIPFDGHTSASGVKAGPLCPLFSYRIIVRNIGTCPLTGVSVVDPFLGGALSGYPSSLAPGDSATNFFSQAVCTNTVNTVVASGASGSVTVSATNSATVTVMNASITCTKSVSTDGVNFASSATIVGDGSAHAVIYELTVKNTSDSGVLLSGLAVSDPSGCLGSVALPSSLASGASFSITCTNLLNCNSIPGGTLTNTAVVSASADSEEGTVCVTSNLVSSSCLAVVSCTAPPCTPNISVTKEITCRHNATQEKPKDCGRWDCGHKYYGSFDCTNGEDCSSLPASDYTGHTIATTVVHEGKCPSFCYRIIVQNTGTCILTNVTVVDPLFGGTLAGYPSTLAPGVSATNFFTTALCTSTVNTVKATGTSASSSTNVTASSSATAKILDASVSCSKLVSTDGVNFASSVNIPQDGNSHKVIFKLTVFNSSDSGVILTNINISDVGGCFTTCKIPSALGSGGSFTILCTNLQNCGTPCTSGYSTQSEKKKNDKTKQCNTPCNSSTSFTDTVEVVAEATAPGACHHTEVKSDCSAVVNCVVPPCTPAISLTKEVVCRTAVTGNGGSDCGRWDCSHNYYGSSSCKTGTDCSSLPGSSYDGHTTALAFVQGSQCPAFCYRIIVKNTGSCTLTNVSVSDPMFGGSLAGYPSTLAPGASATNFFTKSLCVTTVNTASAKGSASSTVAATSSATATLLNASVSCTKLVSTDGVNFASVATVPQDGNPHTVIYKLTVQNTSDSSVVLTNFSISDPNGCLGICKLPISVASGTSFTVLCTSTVNCTSLGCSGSKATSFTNTILVTANHPPSKQIQGHGIRGGVRVRRGEGEPRGSGVGDEERGDGAELSARFPPRMSRRILRRLRPGESPPSVPNQGLAERAAGRTVPRPRR